jgi:cytoskeletal protein CcmA (bactofilin family)
MLGKKGKSTIDSLIGSSTHIKGELNFKGGLRIDGRVTGNVNAELSQPSVLVISEQAKIEGEVRAVHLIVNGEIIGDVYSVDLIELQPKARITGNIHYKAIEMHSGAVISGKLNPGFSLENTPETKIDASGEA